MFAYIMRVTYIITINTKYELVLNLLGFIVSFLQITVLVVQMVGAPCTILTPQKTARPGSRDLPYMEI